MISKPTVDNHIQQIVDEIGVEAYLKLVEAFGGTTLYVPIPQTTAKYLERMLIRKGGARHARTAAGNR